MKDKLDQGAFQELVAYQQAGVSKQLAVPTPDHYLLLLYSVGLEFRDEAMSYAHEEARLGG